MSSPILLENFDIKTDVKIEMFLPIEIFNPFILGISLLGGHDVLDGDLNPQANWDWVQIACEVSELDTDLGGSIENNIYFQPLPGSAQITMQSNTLDPAFNSSVRPGTKIRAKIIRNDFNLTLFNGFIDTLDVGYYPNDDQPNIIRITAYDAYKRLVNKRINLDTTTLPAGYATPLEQIQAIATAAGYELTPPTTEPTGKIPPVHAENTIASRYINDATQVGLAFIWIDPETEKIKFEARPTTTGTPPPDIINIGNNHPSPRHLCMSDIKIASDADAIFNSLKVSLTDDENINTVVQNEGLIVLFGETSIDLDLNTTDLEELNRWALAAFNNSPTKLVQSIETPTVDRLGDLTAAAAFRPGDKIMIDYARNGEQLNSVYAIIGVAHSINVDRFITTLGLWRGA